MIDMGVTIHSCVCGCVLLVVVFIFGYLLGKDS